MTLTDYMCQEKKEEEDCIDVSIKGLEENNKKTKERLISAARQNKNKLEIE